MSASVGQSTWHTDAPIFPHLPSSVGLHPPMAARLLPLRQVLTTRLGTTLPQALID